MSALASLRMQNVPAAEQGIRRTPGCDPDPALRPHVGETSGLGLHRTPPVAS